MAIDKKVSPKNKKRALPNPKTKRPRVLQFSAEKTEIIPKEDTTSSQTNNGKDTIDTSRATVTLNFPFLMNTKEIAKNESPSPARSMTKIGVYDVLKEIGRGGMGKVVLWKDKNIGRLVATKLLLSRNNSEETLQRFWEEGQITGQLEHPNIVPIHEIGIDEKNNPYFTMKYVKGQSLKHIIDELNKNSKMAGEWSLNRMLQIFLDICHAIAYSHSKNVIHRDLKPDNIMLGDFGEVLVMDWGLAKVIGQGQEVFAQDAIKTLRSEGGFMTITGQISGTPLYMSPEQANGKIEELDQRSDIYSLGAILYEMMTGTTCVEGRKSVMAILVQVTTGKLRQMPEKGFWGSFPKELRSIIQKALRLSPDERYQTVQELADDVQRFLDGKEVRACHYSIWNKTAKLFKRYRREITLVIGTIVIVAPICILWSYMAKEAEKKSILLKYREEEKKALKALDVLKDKFMPQMHVASGNLSSEAPLLSKTLENDNLKSSRPLNALPKEQNFVKNKYDMEEDIHSLKKPGGVEEKIDGKKQRSNAKIVSDNKELSQNLPLESSPVTGSTLEKKLEVQDEGKGSGAENPASLGRVFPDQAEVNKRKEKEEDSTTSGRNIPAQSGEEIKNKAKKLEEELENRRKYDAGKLLEAKKAFAEIKAQAMLRIKDYQEAYKVTPDYSFKKLEADAWVLIYKAALLSQNESYQDMARDQIQILLTEKDFKKYCEDKLKS